jgi:hypothetical protein
MSPPRQSVSCFSMKGLAGQQFTYHDHDPFETEKPAHEHSILVVKGKVLKPEWDGYERRPNDVRIIAWRYCHQIIYYFQAVDLLSTTTCWGLDRIKIVFIFYLILELGLVAILIGGSQQLSCVSTCSHLFADINQNSSSIRELAPKTASFRSS